MIKLFQINLKPITALSLSLLMVFALCLPEAISGGYKIPEQSSNAIALSSANVASASGPDAAYYNPANLPWGDEGQQIEVGLNYLRLSKAKFRGTVLTAPADDTSKSENLFLPNIHYISKKYQKFRYGFSLVTPFGLSKRWGGAGQKLFAEEFSLKVLELDASLGYAFSQKLAVGGGIRGIYSKGEVKNDGIAPVPTPSGLIFVPVTREVEGDGFSAGYFLALALRPIKNISMALTYRSEVTSELEGNAKMSATGSPNYDGPVSVEIVLPATFQFATSYTHRRAIIEFVYERTYWHRYKELDFNYGQALNSAVLTGVFDLPIPKAYSDTDTYRLGLTYHYSPKFTLMFGFGIDETPVPESTLNFELPVADALLYSTGFRYHHDESLSFSLAYLFFDQEGRSVGNKNLEGHFESSAQLLQASVAFAF